jgi:Glycosyltransferase family 87
MSTDGGAVLSQQLARLPSDALSTRTRARVAYGALALLLAASLAFALGTASGPSLEVPASKFGFPGWLGGPLPDVGLAMTSARFITLITLMAFCQGAVLAFSGALRVRWALAAVLVAHLIFTLAPPVLSPDVFGYLGYARMGVLHGLNPYAYAPAAIPRDEIFLYVRWREQVDPYGPLFTVLSYPLAYLGVAGGLWAAKAAAGAASLGCVALVWACARRIGRPPLAPVLFVGLNPFLLLYGVGGAHNDLLMMLFALTAVFLVLVSHERLGGTALAGAMAVKASAGLLVPFLVLGARRRRRALAGVLAGVVALGVMTLLVFGEGVTGLLGAWAMQSQKISSHNVPNGLGWFFGLGGVTPGVRAVAGAVLVGSLGLLVVYVWRGGDWLTAMGWATLALLVTTTWLMHWYLVWLLPLAALGRHRSLRFIALVFPAVMVLTGLPPVPK